MEFDGNSNRQQNTDEPAFEKPEAHSDSLERILAQKRKAAANQAQKAPHAQRYVAAPDAQKTEAKAMRTADIANKPKTAERPETASDGGFDLALFIEKTKCKAEDLMKKTKKKIAELSKKRKVRSEAKQKDNLVQDYYDDNEEDSAVVDVLKSTIYIVSVLIVSIVLSYFVIIYSNDVFSFVKAEVNADIKIEDTVSTSKLASVLKEDGIIKYPALFKLYHSFRGYSDTYKGGTYSVSSKMGYDELIKTFLGTKKDRETIILTFYEGQTVDEIIDEFVENGIGTKEGFVDVIQNYPYEYDFISEIPNDPNRRYRLEGYLFPDTYYFYADSNEETAIYKMLENFNSKISEPYYERAKEIGYSLDEVINIASIIQWEAGYTVEFEYVSSVIHNRLSSPNFPKIECDSTIIYAIGGDRKNEVTGADLEYDSPYNTYLYDGLPPGAIGNPGLDAIEAALYPINSNYYYFVASPNGETIFSRTLAEHNAARARIAAQ